MKLSGLSVITDAKDLRGKSVIVRASLDVPIENGRVVNYFRLMRAMPTLLYLSHAGARTIVIGHVGRDPEETLAPVYDVLREHLQIVRAPGIVGPDVKAAIDSLREGETILLENLRSNPGETANDDTFARELASYADYYVNDAFTVSHRAHASTVGIPKYLPSYAGLTFYEEYLQLGHAIRPKHPSLFILGGAKFETKEPLIHEYIDDYDTLFIGGALAHDFFASKGYEVGDSVISDGKVDNPELLTNPKILLPVDVVAVRDGVRRITAPDRVEKGEHILDAGPETLRMLETYIRKAKTILWNGPLGNYEGGFIEGTTGVAKLIAESSAHSIVGGGDTVAAIESLGNHDKFGFVSTAGGAMLDFLEHKTLPGIDAIRSAPKKRQLQ